MKKVVFKIAAAGILLFTQTANAQITLEHTFKERVSFNGRIYFEPSLYPEDCYYNTNISGRSYVVKIYNADYSIKSNNTYNFTPPSGYKVSDVFMSQKLFNTDDSYEFLVTYERTDNVYDNTRFKVILQNQNGSTIKDFGSAYAFSVPSFLHIVNDCFRLYVVKAYYNGGSSSIETEIYSVPGTPPTEVKSIQNETTFLPPFPNPANATITLPYQLKQGEMSVMRIYNIGGQLIETKQIDYVFDKILLNVSGYARGVYFYEVNGVSKKFVVE